jgi:hypothetical protein
MIRGEGKRKMSGIKDVIVALGYSNSSSLLYFNTVGIESNRRICKLFEELDATAIYTVNGTPFILFFETDEKYISDQMVKKIWNAQIPLAVISLENRIEVYNGCSIDNKNNLIILEDIDIVTLGQTSPFSLLRITDPIFF